MAKSLPPLGSATGADRAAAWPICRSRVPIVPLVYRQMGRKSGPHVPKSVDGKAPGEHILAGRLGEETLRMSPRNSQRSGPPPPLRA